LSTVTSVRIKDPWVWLKFKDFVLRKHGKLHGALGGELIHAIKFYLENADALTQSNLKYKINRRGDDFEFRQIKNEVLKYVEPGGSLPLSMLREIIMRVSNVKDHRSVRSRVEKLIAEGFIKRDWQADSRGRVFRVMSPA